MIITGWGWEHFQKSEKFKFSQLSIPLPNWVPVGPFWVDLWVEIEKSKVAEAT